jgi:hypothetical protein
MFSGAYFEFRSFVHLVDDFSRSLSGRPVQVMALDEDRVLRHAAEEDVAFACKVIQTVD